MSHQLFDYPPFPHQQPSAAMKELYEKTRERLKASKVAIITAKEGGDTREFVAGVDDVISIHHALTHPGPVTLVRRKPRL